MGWLRDLMRGAEPPVRSFGALARAALSHSAWPEQVRTRERSLATVLSKLDRDLDLEWLADRADVQRVLAEVLGCAVADVQAAVVAGTQQPDRATRRVRLEDLRYARALDLTEESLPPGIPDPVLHPETWTRLWWIAPPGAGRTLTGRWLEARGLATFARSPDELERKATRAPVFVELTGPAAKLPQRERLCIAAPFPPPSGDWQVVVSEPVGAYLPELTRWIADRLENDGHFEPERAARWIAVAAERGDVDSLGTALGLAGMIDELGFRSLEGKTLADAARRYVELRLSQWRRDQSGDTAGLERRAFDLLVGIVMRTLTDDEQPWNAPRSHDEWMALVPPEHQHGADADWLRLTLPRVDATVRASDIEKAARRLPPGAYRIVRALAGARILCPRAEDQLAIAPRWLGTVACREAERGLARASPFEWGEALLSPHAAAGVARAVLTRARAGELALLQSALELEDEDNPAYVVALETAVRAAGLALLSGTELPAELAEELSNEQARLWLQLPNAPPLPRIASASDDALLGPGSWYLALLALSDAAAAPLPVEEDQLCAVLDSIADALRALPRAIAIEAQALLDRTLGARSHPLLAGSALMDALANGGVHWEHVRALEPSAALSRLAEQRGVSFERVATAIWNSWNRAERPPLAPVLVGGEAARKLWHELPPELAGAVLERCARDGVAAPVSALGERHWAALVGNLSKLALMPDLLAALPDALVPGLLETAPPAPYLRALWASFPNAVSAALARHLADGRFELAAALTAEAPANTSSIARAWRERAELDRVPDPALTPLRRWLHARVGERAPGWREAYALLADIERLVSRSRPGV